MAFLFADDVNSKELSMTVPKRRFFFEECECGMNVGLFSSGISIERV